jgi:hypothetical protein
MIALTRSRQLILVSVLSIPLMVSVVALEHLISLEASNPQPLVVPSLEEGKTEPPLSIAPEPPTTTPEQTDRERQNVAQAQLQDGDWLMKRSQLKAAKSVYQDLLGRSDLGQNSEVQNLASQRLEKLEKAIVATQIKDKQTKDKQAQDKLKAEAKKKSLLKPEIKSAIKPAVRPATQAVTFTEPQTPLSVSSPEPWEMQPQELTPANFPQPSSAIDPQMGTPRIGEKVRFEFQADLTTEPLEAGFGPGADRVTPRLVPNSFAE